MKQKKCALCGRRMRLHERNNGWPLVDADVCPECNYSRVVPTRICGGIPSHVEAERDNEGCLVYRIVADKAEEGGEIDGKRDIAE